MLLLEQLNQMDSSDMELECDGSCETSKIVRDEDTDAKRKTIDVDLDSYGREDVPNPPKIRKNVKQSMVGTTLRGLKVILMTLVLNVNIVELFMHVILNVMVLGL